MLTPWKYATLGILALGGTVATSAVTTAYLLRPPVASSEASVAVPAPPRIPDRSAVTRSPARPAVRVASVAPTPVMARAAGESHGPAPAPVVVSSPASEPSATPVPAPSAVPAPVAVSTSAAPGVSPASVPADCETGGDRALRIAKPGALGALLGAGLGAAGGAIADGGKGAGKGALIGGIAGAALGGGYGAYKTKNECGTIFGDTSSRTVTPASGRGTVAADRTAPLSPMPPAEERIQVYHAR